MIDEYMGLLWNATDPRMGPPINAILVMEAYTPCTSPCPSIRVTFVSSALLATKFRGMLANTSTQILAKMYSRCAGEVGARKCYNLKIP